MRDRLDESSTVSKPLAKRHYGSPTASPAAGSWPTPKPKRQPNLLFGVVRLLGGPLDDPTAFHAFTVSNWPAIAAELRARATQTNEAGRCALLLPVLAMLPQPLALFEVGAAAGLGLYPDRYVYRYDDHEIGSDGPVLDCTLTGTPPPTQLPTVAWRAGLDLNPLDVTDPTDVAWLEALIWPEHHHRRDRLRAAAAIAAADPPTLNRGDLVDDLPSLAAQTPTDATLVVFHTSVLYQSTDRAPHIVRRPGTRTARTLDRGGKPGRPAIRGTATATGRDVAQRVLTLDGTPLAWTRGHGQAMAWFA